MSFWIIIIFYFLFFADSHKSIVFQTFLCRIDYLFIAFLEALVISCSYIFSILKVSNQFQVDYLQKSLDFICGVLCVIAHDTRI